MYPLVRECRRCLDLLSERFSVSLVWVPGHSNVLGNCRADEIARAGALLLESSSIELGMPLASFKLASVRKFFPDANLSWVNEESCSIARLTWPIHLYIKDSRITNQLLGLEAEEEETVIHFFCQFPSLGMCRNRLFGSPFLVSYHLLTSRI